MLDDLPKDMDGASATPAENHLFVVNQGDAKALDTETALMLHHNTAKLLFRRKRAIPDIQTAAAFLAIRVKGPDGDDY
jgi:hypothetical protein